MENASKALIIAGAILISIVIISLGVVIVNNVRGTIEGAANMSAQEVATFNAKFESYQGTQRGANVKALVNLIKSHNLNVDDDSMKVDVVNEDASGDWKASQVTGTVTDETIKAGVVYTVTFGKDPASGRITKCGFTEKQ